MCSNALDKFRITVLRLLAIYLIFVAASLFWLSYSHFFTGWKTAKTSYLLGYHTLMTFYSWSNFYCSNTLCARFNEYIQGINLLVKELTHNLSIGGVSFIYPYNGMGVCSLQLQHIIIMIYTAEVLDYLCIHACTHMHTHAHTDTYIFVVIVYVATNWKQIN